VARIDLVCTRHACVLVYTCTPEANRPLKSTDWGKGVCLSRLFSNASMLHKYFNMCLLASCTIQVDKHKSDASRELNEIHRRAEQEKTQRTCMMR